MKFLLGGISQLLALKCSSTALTFFSLCLLRDHEEIWNQHQSLWIVELELIPLVKAFHDVTPTDSSIYSRLTT